MSWGTLVGALGLILAAIVAVWYKNRAQSSAMDAWLADHAKDQATESQQLAEKQLAQKAEQEREQLNAEIARIQAITDADTRRAQLLAVLVRLRGAH